MNRDGSPVVNWVSGKVWVNNHAHVLRSRDGGLNLRYLYFYLQTIDIRPYVTGSTQPKLNQKNLNRIPIPCPDRHDQDRLVALLDSYESLIGDLVAFLSSEIAARRQRYAHHRDKLLTFADASSMSDMRSTLDV